MTAHFSRRLFLPFAGLSMIALMRVSAHAETPTVDGEPITEDDIVQRTRLLSMSTHKLSERQDVINLLTDEKSRVRDAEKYGVGPTNEDVDRAYLEMCSRMHITPEQLTKSLEGQGVHLDTLRQRIKADIARVNLARLRR